jgi:hypothetical protein
VGIARQGAQCDGFEKLLQCIQGTASELEERARPEGNSRSVYLSCRFVELSLSAVKSGAQ